MCAAGTGGFGADRSEPSWRALQAPSPSAPPAALSRPILFEENEGVTVNRHFSRTSPLGGLAIAVFASVFIACMVGVLFAAKATDKQDGDGTCALGGSIHPEFGTPSGAVPVFCVFVHGVEIGSIAIPAGSLAWGRAVHRLDVHRVTWHSVTSPDGESLHENRIPFGYSRLRPASDALRRSRAGARDAHDDAAIPILFRPKLEDEDAD